MAILRAATAAGLLFVLAPEESRQAVAAIVFGADDLRRSLPTRDDAARAALAHCRAQPDLCAEAARKFGEAAGHPAR
jgi:citrate lyase beta subunit